MAQETELKVIQGDKQDKDGTHVSIDENHVCVRSYDPHAKRTFELSLPWRKMLDAFFEAAERRRNQGK